MLPAHRGGLRSLRSSLEDDIGFFDVLVFTPLPSTPAIFSADGPALGLHHSKSRIHVRFTCAQFSREGAITTIALPNFHLDTCIFQQFLS